MIEINPSRSIVMHIDVQPLCAKLFDDHYLGIADFVNDARAAGAAVIGVTFNHDDYPSRPITSEEALQRSLIKPDDRDFNFHKAEISALSSSMFHLPLHRHIYDLMEQGRDTLALVGYYLDQCVFRTAEDASRLLPQLKIRVVEDMCSAWDESFDSRDWYGKLPNVKLIESVDMYMEPCPSQPYIIPRVRHLVNE